MKKQEPNYEIQSIGEEIANSIIHGISVLLAIAGTVLLVVFSAKAGKPAAVTAYSIYGASLILLFLMSTLEHSLVPVAAKNVFEILDHAFVFVLIAGTYTPISLIFLKGAAGWTLFGIAWGLATAGIIFKAFFTGRHQIISLAFYLLMGWIVVPAVPALLAQSRMFVMWLGIGGLLYTLGTVFFAFKRLPGHHVIWHVFVMLGACAHFFGFLFYGI